jgi:three-Cys-motif partner protein
MNDQSPNKVAEPSEHYFGGDWTVDKLGRLRKYLAAYTKIMTKQNFKFAYIDAFAGTGYISKEQNNDSDTELFLDLGLEEPQSFLSGSVKTALEIEPRFNKYIFIEKDTAHCKDLQTTCNEYPELMSRVSIINEEANSFLQDLCNNSNWSQHRAVLFLDPYGMQVEWKTIESIARTKAIDMWLLFPLGMSINRMLIKNGNIPIPWVEKLDRFFGTHDWEQQFYQQQIFSTLFGDEVSNVKTCDYKVIQKYFIERLKTIFPCVAENPLTLCNSKTIPLFLLCFAAGNEKGGKVAKRIAEYILKV